MKMITALTAAAAIFTATTAFATEVPFATPAQEVYLSTINTATPEGAAQYDGMVAAIYAGELANREAYVRQVATETPLTIFTLEISQGEPTVTRTGPLMDFGQCDHMVKQATADITRSYETTHPEGWTDANGNVWQLADWNIECVAVQPFAS